MKTKTKTKKKWPGVADAFRPASRLLGLMECSIDQNNRLTIPLNLRPPGGVNELIIILDPNNHLVALTRDPFSKTQELAFAKISDLTEQRHFSMPINHIARTVPMDKQGRITLTPQEIEHLGATDRLVVFTMGNEHSLFEVWCQQFYRESGSAIMSKIGI